MIIFNIFTNIGYIISRKILQIALIIFFKFKVKGGENMPSKGPFIIASNHISYMDPPIVGSACRRIVHFIASDHLYKNRLFGLWYRLVGCIMVKREEPSHTAMRKILNHLRQGRVIAIFPEGTRSEDGKRREPLSGLGFLALKSQVPVVPCCVEGSEKALPKGAKSFTSSSITAHIGKPIEPKDFEYKGDKKAAYRLFSKKVMDSITQLGTK